MLDYYSATKRIETEMHAAVDRTLKTLCKWKKPTTKDRMFYDSLVWNVQNRQIYRHKEGKLMVFLGEGWETADR